MWVLIQYDWHPYEKRLGQRQVLREDHVKTQGEGGHRQARGRFQEKQPRQHLDLRYRGYKVLRK